MRVTPVQRKKAGLFNGGLLRGVSPWGSSEKEKAIFAAEGISEGGGEGPQQATRST